MLIKKLLLLFFLSITLLNAQISNDSILKKINNAKNIVADKDPKKAIKIALETKKLSKQNHYDYGIMKSAYTLMLLYYNGGSYKKVIEEARIAEEYAIKLDDNDYLSDIFRMKAITYGEMGFSKEALKELSKSLPYADKIKLKNKSLYTKAIIYEAYAGTYEKLGDTKKQIENRHKSILASKKMNDTAKTMVNRKFHNLALQYGSLAYTYNNLKKKDSALFYFNEALKIYNNKDIDIYTDGKATLLSDLAVFHSNNKDYNNSIKFAKQAEKLEKQTTLPYIRRDIFKSLFDSYAGINKVDSSKYYLSLYTVLNDSIIKVEKKSLYTPVNQIISDKEKEKNSTVKNVIFISAITSVLLLLFGWLFWSRKNKKLKEDYNKLIRKLAHDNYGSGTSSENTSTAIKDPRIAQVVHLLYSDPKSRMYTEDELAKNHGFTSKTEFTTAFKKATGIPFSYFIKKVQKQ
ncbi:hypothetical protein SAMN05443633_103111 [Chryseobacterium arachidis]|uniref:HTH araC/xylS-type domain-containing protein n=1 Tax=Chryseobacterium arachidis TaxID=1416778 RepID=A0A1M4ZB48_9FLAO|nr:hypothetical protein [Chryseobacterium arachidis]SHF15270.1 hypothetical protein SAMN05443633_103111 [Chryseobacterium arachidis]